MTKKLSPRQERILDYIGEFIDDNTFPPTVRDIQSGCEISSTSVVDYNLQILQREGHIERQPEVSRGIILVQRQRSRDSLRNIVSVPVYGSIAAGEPLLVPSAAERSEPDESLDLPTFLTKGKSDVYALRVKGTSMIDAYIYDGDLVIMEPINQPETGDMVAAWLEDRGETTLKRFFLEGDTVRLQPENENMEPIIVPAANVTVRGRVVGVIRTL